MKRFTMLLGSLLLAAGVLVGCAGADTSASSSSKSATSSSASVSAAASSNNSGFASSDTVSSDAASSDAASSDAASSDAASSNAASSGSSNRSAGAVLSGPSGLAKMNVAMHYISDTETLAIIDSGDASKVIVDLRKPEDAKAGHIKGAIFAPMNKAVDNNDYAEALANLTGALHDATGNEVGEGKELVLVCYAGKKYAQAATDILNALGADMDKVYTLEGGMTAWNEAGHPVVTD